MKRKIQQISLAILGTALLLVLLGVSYLQAQTYPAQARANKIAQTATQTESNYRFFQGKNGQKTILLYPGALVESASYAYLAQKLQTTGYNVYLIQAPLNLPILDSQAALHLIQDQKIPSQDVILMGHSLGGVVAASNAQTLLKNGKSLAGLVFLASYPSGNTDLSQASFPVLSITADQDKVMKQDNYTRSKKQLPADTRYTIIKGGNHSGFGLYGHQKGDGPAGLSNLDQQKEIVAVLESFFK